VLRPDGHIIEIGTGKVFNPLVPVEKLESLINGVYLMKQNNGTHELVDLGGPIVDGKGIPVRLLIREESGEIVISSDRRFAFVQNKDGKASLIYDLEQKKEYFLNRDFFHSSARNPQFSHLQFSHDGRYLMYREISDGKGLSFIIVDLQSK